MVRRAAPLSEDFSLVNVRHHEGSTVLSYEGESSLPWEQLHDTIRDLIDRIQQEVDRQEGIVGHVKAFIEDDGSGCAFTATGYEIHTKPAKERTSKIRFAAIVFMDDEGPIVEMMEEVFTSI